MMNSPPVFVQWRLPIRGRVCLASASSGVKTEQLREQLDRLHKEAETTTAKANSARLRFLRLSEAADSLRRQAVLSVRTGQENGARELLHQKKKVMKAMEKSKNRIELLDELSEKLRQVISAKETQLIGNVGLDLEIGRDAAATNIRVVPPKDESYCIAAETEDSESSIQSLDLNEKLQADSQSLEDQQNDSQRNNFEGLLKGDKTEVVDPYCTVKENLSSSDFFKNIDCQLNEIESELTTFFRYSELILGSKDNLENSKVQLVLEILENVCHIRERIAAIMQTEVKAK